MADGDLMTLPEYAKSLDKNSVERPLVESFAASSDLMQVLPFEGFTGAAYEFYREGALPENMAFRAINEGSTKGTGKLDPLQEASYVLDHDIDVDAAIVRRYGEIRRAREERLGMAKAGRLWANTFIYGDNSNQPREFNGIKKRCTVANGRVIHNSGASGGAALSLAKLDELLFMVNGANAIIAPRLMVPRFIAAARNTTIAGFVIQSWNEIGIPKMSYAGRRIYFGYEREIEGDLLDFNEVASGGGSAVTASIYAAKLGEGGLRGIQLAALTVRDVGLLEDQITMRSHVSWDVGLVDEHRYCLGRLTSITNAAFTA